MKEKILLFIQQLDEELRCLMKDNTLDYHEAVQREDEIFQKMKILKEEAIFCDGPDLSNDIIDLYEGKYPNHFEIYLHGTRTRIGSIEYRGRMDYYIKDVGYSIQEEYRGHHYALTALKLIRGRMVESGNKEVYISVLKENIPSIKTIEAFGAKLVEDNHGTLLYRYDIENSEEELPARKR